MPESALSSFGKRFFAAILDLLILSFCGGILAFFLNEGLVFFYLSLYWLYFAGFESSSLQATPGKLALSLKVGNGEGGRIGFGKASLRFFGKFLSGMSMGIGFLMIAFNEERQMLHDRIAGTFVRGRKSSPSGNTERAILLAARRNGGRLSPLVIAAESDIGVDEARRQLEDMCIRGLCRPEVTEDGRIEYHFPDFLPGDKA